ncbi:MAG: DUF87 domain-containing protein [Nanoarchaeota archaeon]
MAYAREFLNVEEICRKLKPVLGSKIDQIYLTWKLTEDRDRKFEIEQMLNALYVKHLNDSLLHERVLLQPPPKDIIGGPYPLGMVTYAEKELYPFGLREQDWQRHVCVVGMSGSGKTNFAYQIIRTFMARQKPFIIFDWKKSFRPLLEWDESMLLFTVGNSDVANHFRVNINAPPKGVAPKEWIGVLADTINECFNASHGVHKVLSETLDELFKKFGVYHGSKRYPTWFHVKKRLEERDREDKRGRDAEWVTSALRIAHSMTFGSFGETLNSNDPHGFAVDDLLSKQVIFELASLGATEKKFFCEYVLTYLYKYLKANQSELRDDFRSAIIVDEAHNIFLKDKTFFLKESITESIYREVREYGISLVCLDQHVSKLSDVVAGNSACVVAFQQMLPLDIREISGVMQMTEQRNFFSMLPVGVGIVRLADRYHSPFLVKFPLIEVNKMYMTDEMIGRRVSRLVDTFMLRRIVAAAREPDTDPQPNAEADIFRRTGIVGAPPSTAPVAVADDVDPDYVNDELWESDKSQLTTYKHNLMNNVQHLTAMNPRFESTAKERERIDASIEHTERVHSAPKDAVMMYKQLFPDKVLHMNAEHTLSGGIPKKKHTDDKVFAKEHELKKRGEFVSQMRFHDFEDEIWQLQGVYKEPAQPGALLRRWEPQRVFRAYKAKDPVRGGFDGSKRIDTYPIYGHLNRVEKNLNTQGHTLPGYITTNQEQHNDSSTIKTSHSLTKPQQDFITAIRQRQDLSISQLYQHLGLSARKGNEIKNELISLGILNVVEERSVTGWRKTLVVTD